MSTLPEWYEREREAVSEDVASWPAWMRREAGLKKETEDAMGDEEAFQARLDAEPGNWETRLVFADWLEERGDPRAEGYRALGLLRLYPTQWLRGWKMKQGRWGPALDGHYYLPPAWFETIKRRPEQFRLRRQSRRRLEDEVTTAFALLPVLTREEILSAGAVA